MLIWTYNPQGLSYHQLETFRRTDIWISREGFLETIRGKIPGPPSKKLPRQLKSQVIIQPMFAIFHLPVRSP